jgi:hypothetical protein
MAAMPGRRSPSYPFIDLETALQRARVLYDRERHNAVPSDVAVGHWDYRPSSSDAGRTLAALRAFGLLQGDQEVRLTDRALRILRDDRETSPERDELLRQSALLPALHGKLWGRYRESLPSDQTLRLVLLNDWGFNENSVDEFIAQLRRTLEYAGVRRGTVREERESAPEPAPSEAPFLEPDGEVDPVHFPLLDGNAVQFRVRRKISAGEAGDLRQLFEIWLKKIQR